MTGDSRFLIHSLLTGICITFFYDFFRILRKVIPHTDFFVSLEDFVFWIYCTIQVFILMNAQGDGSLRWFAVLGALLGMFVYHKAMSPYYVQFASFLLRKMVHFLLIPIQFMLHKANQLRKHMRRLLTLPIKAFTIKRKQRHLHCMGRKHEKNEKKKQSK